MFCFDKLTHFIQLNNRNCLIQITIRFSKKLTILESILPRLHLFLELTRNLCRNIQPLWEQVELIWANEITKFYYYGVYMFLVRYLASECNGTHTLWRQRRVPPSTFLAGNAPTWTSQPHSPRGALSRYSKKRCLCKCETGPLTHGITSVSTER